jgi:hypothetical protein
MEIEMKMRMEGQIEMEIENENEIEVIWDISKSHIDGNTTSGENRRQKILES